MEGQAHKVEVGKEIRAMQDIKAKPADQVARVKSRRPPLWNRWSWNREHKNLTALMAVTGSLQSSESTYMAVTVHTECLRRPLCHDKIIRGFRDGVLSHD